MTTDFLIKVEETFCSKGTLLEQLGENFTAECSRALNLTREVCEGEED